jgi:hypothetical protein
MVSIGNLSEEAAIKNSDFKRTTVRVNVNTKLKEWFRTGANVASTFTDSNQAVDGAANTNSFNNPFRTIRYMGPIYPVLSHDSTTGEGMQLVTQYIRKYVGLVLQMVETLFMKL